MKNPLLIALITIPLLVLLTALAPEPPSKDSPAAPDQEAHTPPAPTTSPGFELLKSLAGDWVMLDEDGVPGEDIALSYRVIAGGSAVVETDFPGTPQEMLTVFHHDGKDLILTHYCMLGNQPHMKATNPSAQDQLIFICTGESGGGTNMASELDQHMHQGTINFIDKDHITSEWLLFDQGEKTHTAKFIMQKK